MDKGDDDMVDDKTRVTNTIKGVFVILLYFFVSFFKTLPLDLLRIDYNNLSLFTRELYGILIEIILILIIIFTFKDQFKKAFQDIKKNHLKYFSSNFKYYMLGFFVMVAANLLINLLGGSLSNNEAAVRDQFSLAPIYTYLSGVFLAPILEESVFRLSLRNIFKNPLVFVVMSGAIFGGLHLMGMTDSPLLPLYFLSYSIFGIVFAYIMVKTNNIFVSMGFHFMHNGILMSLQFFILLFG